MKPPSPSPAAPPNSRKTWIASAILGIAIAIAAALILIPSIRLALQRAREAETTRSTRSIGLTCGSFAMDNDGLFPNPGTAAFYGLSRSSSSNDLFRQLFASGTVRSERIFWVKHSAICIAEVPDDITSTGSEFDPDQTLRPGDNHWAYFSGLTNVDPPSRPLMLDSYLPGTTTFDTALWHGKLIVLRVDNSANAMVISPAGTILDGDGKNLLTTDSIVWKDGTPDLRQPDPAP